MDSPAKKTRHEEQHPHYGVNIHGSPIQPTRTGANPETPLLDFNFDPRSPTIFYGAEHTPMSYLPTHIPSSNDWSPSMMREASNIPDNFNFNDALSPARFQPAPTRTVNGSGGSRGTQKRSGSSSLLSSSSGASNKRLESISAAGGTMGIALSDGGFEPVLDEESQSFLSDSTKALAERIRNASRLSGRYTPDANFDDAEGTRHGIRSSSRAGQQSSSGPSSLLAPPFPFASDASALTAGLRGSNGSGAGAGGPQLTRSSTAGSGVDSDFGDNGHGEASLDSAPEADSGASNLMFGSQQSDGSLLQALTQAAESLKPSPSNKPTTASGKGSARRAKGRVRSYNSPSLNSSALAYTAGIEVSASSLPSAPGDHEVSNLSFETGSSGNSNSGSGLGSRMGPPSAAAGMPTYSTPSLKMVSSAASAASALNSSGKPVACNCKRSRCLKMYCDCFRLTLYCRDACRCKDCANVEGKNPERQAAIDSIVERNPEAFKPRVAADPSSNAKGHLTGCHCRKSSCLKKYCECFGGGVPCGERCRCVDCKNAPTLHRHDMKPRLDFLAAPGINRKDSVGSETGLGAMSAIMQDKRGQFHSVLSSGLKAGGRSGGGLTGSAGFGPSLGLNTALYFDPEMSNASLASSHSLSYSHDAYGRVPYGASSSSSGAGLVGSPVRLARADSKLAFSSPKANTDPSSGANSNRSVLDNEEAAEVLSVMNSPNNYMRPGPFNPENIFGPYRDTVASSIASSSAQSASHTLSASGTGLTGRAQLLGDMDQEAAQDSAVEGCAVGLQGHSLMKEVASRAEGGLGGLSIDTTAGSGSGSGSVAGPGSSGVDTGSDGGPMSLSTAATVSTQLRQTFTPSEFTYNSPAKPLRRPAAGLPSHSQGEGGGEGDEGDAAADAAALKSPSLWDLADFCEKHAEEEQRKSQLNSPVYQRS